MTRSHQRLAALGVCALLAACGAKGGRDDYVKDGDSGQAAPATMTEANHPTTTRDSTNAVSQRTGTPEVAGDKLGQHNMGAIPNTPEAGRAAAAAAGATTPAPVKAGSSKPNP